MTPELRALFPITERAIYLNHAAVSPPPTTTIQAVEAQLKDVHENGSANFRDWLAVKEQARRASRKPSRRATRAGRLHAQHLGRALNRRQWPQLAHVATTSSLSAVSSPRTSTRGCACVTPSASKCAMCEERGGRIDFAELSSLIDHKTRVVAISHVQYASGFRMDLERLGRLARQHDALFVVDVIQALGVVPNRC